MGFARLLLIFACIYFGMKLIRMYVVPFLFKKATSKMRENMEGRMRDFQSQNDPRQEGEVRVETPKSSKASIDRVDEGDYVEFEEID